MEETRRTDRKENGYRWERKEVNSRKSEPLEVSPYETLLT